MRRLAVLLCLLVAACAEQTLPSAANAPPSPVRYNLLNNGLVGCQTWGFDTICHKG